MFTSAPMPANHDGPCPRPAIRILPLPDVLCAYLPGSAYLLGTGTEFSAAMVASGLGSGDLEGVRPPDTIGSRLHSNPVLDVGHVGALYDLVIVE
jgi:hypothetical protein